MSVEYATSTTNQFSIFRRGLFNMKIKRLVLMLAFAILIVSIPLLANPYQDTPAQEDPGAVSRDISYINDGIEIIGDPHPVLTFSVYGYGTIQAHSATLLGPLLSGAQIEPGTVVNFAAVGLNQTGFEFLGWTVNGMPYRGLPSPNITLTIEEDTHVMAIFDHPWAAESTPPPSNYTIVRAVSAVGNADGSITIRIPGYSGTVISERLTTSTTIEFRVTPPAQRFFDSATELTVSNDIELTLDPVVLADGRLSFTMLPPSINQVMDQNANAADGNENEEGNFAVAFEPAGGTMPSGAQLVQSLPYNSVINPLPTPAREGYSFSGWRLNGNIAVAPITVTADLVFTAQWASLSDGYSDYSEGQYVVGFNPAPGAFANANESGMRLGDYGTIVNNIPQAPTRAGYTFGGWRLPNGNTLSGNQLTIRGDMILTAIWTASAAASPSPSPSPNPSPSPSPTPGQAGARPNPQTNPISISFMIFGVVLVGGMSAFGIMKLARKQLAIEGQYRTDVARFNREKRITDLIEKD